MQMQNEIILQISSLIKDIRVNKRITQQELADKAEVTKGLLSQVENNRTVPSLSVLLSIIKGLELDLNDFFSNLSNHKVEIPLIIKKGGYSPLKKENSKGCYYNRITSLKQDGKLIDIVLYKQDKNIRRPPASTNAFEFDFMLEGKMEYLINKKKYVLEAGDSFYYDASQPHVSKCLSEGHFTMLVIYFFKD